MKEALYIWVSFQSILFGGSVLVLKRNILNKLLALFFFITGIHTSINYLVRFTDLKFDFPRIIGIGDLFNLMYGPILYLYIKALVDKGLNPKNYWHFLPAPLFLVAIGIYHLQTEELNFMTYISTALHRVIISTVVISNIAYLTLSSRKYLKYSESHKKVERWISVWFAIAIVFLALKVIINSAFLTSFFAVTTISAEFRNFLVYLFISLNAVIVFIAGFYTLRYPNVFKLFEAGIIRKKTANTLENKEAEKILNKVKGVLEEKKLYLKYDLTEVELARELGIQPYILSKILNENVGDNFNRFINRFRIEEAKKILLSPEYNQATIYAIARNSGFKTESVFYTNFKKYVGLTPNQYRKSV